jgi:hypothetical protein
MTIDAFCAATRAPSDLMQVRSESGPARALDWPDVVLRLQRSLSGPHYSIFQFLAVRGDHRGDISARIRAKVNRTVRPARTAGFFRVQHVERDASGIFKPHPASSCIPQSHRGSRSGPISSIAAVSLPYRVSGMPSITRESLAESGPLIGQ